MYEQGKALNAAALFEIDDVIDPADTRRFILAGLRSAPPPAPSTGKKHAWIDACRNAILSARTIVCGEESWAQFCCLSSDGDV